MSDREHARMMLAAAQTDLRALKGMLDEDVFAAEVFGFHAQQAAEKALKAWLSHCGAAYPKIHDLAELLAAVEDQGLDVPAEFRSLGDLTDFAVQFRYQAFEGLGQELDRQATVQQVADFLAHVEAAVAGPRDT